MHHLCPRSRRYPLFQGGSWHVKPFLSRKIMNYTPSFLTTMPLILIINCLYVSIFLLFVQTKSGTTFYARVHLVLKMMNYCQILYFTTNNCQIFYFIINYFFTKKFTNYAMFPSFTVTSIE